MASWVAAYNAWSAQNAIARGATGLSSIQSAKNSLKLDWLKFWSNYAAEVYKDACEKALAAAEEAREKRREAEQKRKKASEERQKNGGA